MVPKERLCENGDLSHTCDLCLSLWAERVRRSVDRWPGALCGHGDSHSTVAQSFKFTQAFLEQSGLRRVLQLLSVS